MNGTPTAVGERLFVGMQYLLPQHLLSRAMHTLARARARPVRRLAIRAFLGRYTVNLAEAEHADPDAYDGVATVQQLDTKFAVLGQFNATTHATRIRAES